MRVGQGVGGALLFANSSAILTHSFPQNQRGLHPNTLRYRLRRFEELTRCDLKDPDRRMEVWWALERARLDAAAATNTS